MTMHPLPKNQENLANKRASEDFVVGAGYSSMGASNDALFLAEGDDMLPFFKLRNTDLTYRLLYKDTNAFKLLTLIASRVKTNDEYSELSKLQCYISKGDSAIIGVSETTLRRALKRLESDRQVTIKAAPKGKVITLLNTAIYDFDFLSGGAKAARKRRESGAKAAQNLDLDHGDTFTRAPLIPYGDLKEKEKDKENIPVGDTKEKEKDKEKMGKDPQTPRVCVSSSKRKKIPVASKPPTLEDVEAYFTSKGWSLDSAGEFYNYFTEGEWVDSKGEPVYNWKQKSLTWNSHRPLTRIREKEPWEY